MPEADMDQLIKENQELASQISDLETILGGEEEEKSEYLDSSDLQ